MSVVMVISNHPDLADQIARSGCRFSHARHQRHPRTRPSGASSMLLRGNVDLVVLARYMQIITSPFLAEVGCPLINIHHSFLPAFIGAAPTGQKNAASN